jgi:hypothetical protein
VNNLLYLEKIFCDEVVEFNFELPGYTKFSGWFCKISLSTCLTIVEVSLRKSQLMKFIMAVSFTALLYFCAAPDQLHKRITIIRDSRINNWVKKNILNFFANGLICR